MRPGLLAAHSEEVCNTKGQWARPPCCKTLRLCGILFIDVSVKSPIIFQRESVQCFCASQSERSMSTFASGIMEQQCVDRYWPGLQTSSCSWWRWVERKICTQAATDLLSSSAVVQTAPSFAIIVFSVLLPVVWELLSQYVSDTQKWQCCTKTKSVRRPANEPRRQLLVRPHHARAVHGRLTLCEMRLPQIPLKWTLVRQGRELWYSKPHYALQTVTLLTPEHSSISGWKSRERVFPSVYKDRLCNTRIYLYKKRLTKAQIKW